MTWEVRPFLTLKADYGEWFLCTSKNTEIITLCPTKDGEERTRYKFYSSDREKYMSVRPTVYGTDQSCA